MNIDSIRKIELEITSDCNAACPGCARTQHIDKLEIKSFMLSDLLRLFPDTKHIKDKQFKFCGVLGDPALNKDAVSMTEHLTDHGGYCQWSTNGAYQTSDWCDSFFCESCVINLPVFLATNFSQPHLFARCCASST